MRMYGMHECNMYWQTDGFSHWVAKIGEPFGSWLIFEILGDHVNQYEGRDDTSGHL
jgi:hypothetical protein